VVATRDQERGKFGIVERRKWRKRFVKQNKLRAEAIATEGQGSPKAWSWSVMGAKKKNLLGMFRGMKRSKGDQE